jgi:hypothetical protein
VLTVLRAALPIAAAPFVIAAAPLLAAGAAVAGLAAVLDLIVFGVIPAGGAVPGGTRRLVHPGPVDVAGRTRPASRNVTPLTPSGHGALPKPSNLAHGGTGARAE